MRKYEILNRIKELYEKDPYAIVAIDGRCASGKSTFANEICEYCHASLIRMDDFFLQPHQRTEERYAEPGGNVDYERFLEQVLLPMVRKEEVIRYQVFDCGSMSLTDWVEIRYDHPILIEGSYSHRPELRDHYALKIFMTIDMDHRMERIEVRDKGNVDDFVNKWIPYEEKYFTHYKVEENADIVYDTTEDQ